MPILVCPGVHSSELTRSFLAEMDNSLYDAWVFPANQPPYSAFHILKFLYSRLAELPGRPAVSAVPRPAQVPLLFIAFSAGVVGAIAAAHSWQGLGGQVKALIALDGWGVPLYGNFPIHRVSHDAFTHWSSALLGSGEASFYADPAVEHLTLWRSPQTVWGWQVSASSPSAGDGDRKADRSHLIGARTPMTAAQFILTLLSRYDT
jgi:hypothetical protein